MIALLSNDDGYLAKGLIELQQICTPIFDQVHVYAPDRNCSGASSSLTLRHPLYIQQHSNGFISVEGTPSDCVHLALSGHLKPAVDIVISGINLGANLGDDVIYSGTVAAAIEGRFLGYPSIAVSMTSFHPQHYETTRHVLTKIFKGLQSHPIDQSCILNINIPDLPLNELKGIKITRLGFRHKAEPIIEKQDKHGNPLYWIGSAGKVSDNEEGTDFHAIDNGYASITPLQIDLTKHTLLTELNQWLTHV